MSGEQGPHAVGMRANANGSGRRHVTIAPQIGTKEAAT